MGSSVNDTGASGANGQRLQGEGVSAGEKRTASGTSAGEWLVNVADDVVVPMSTAEVAQGVRTGKLSERSLVWRIGMHDWANLLDVPQLRLATSMPPPASARVAVQPPASAPVAEPRKRNTLPFGFPAVRDAASVQKPGGLAATSPVSTPLTSVAPTATPRLNPPPKPTGARPSVPPPKPVLAVPVLAVDEESGALAVYDRPAASLTFSDSALAEWQGTGRIVRQTVDRAATDAAPRLTPLPPRLAPLPRRTRSSRAPTTLAPITSEAGNAPDSRAAAPWGDLSVVLASEYRAVQATSKRVALWAAVGSAVVASVFTLWLVRSPASVSAPAAALPHMLAASAPAPAPTLEAPAPNSELPSAPPQPLIVTTAAKPTPAVARVASKPVAARPRPKAQVALTPSPTSDAVAPAESVASEPSTAAAPASTPTEIPAPSAPSAPALEVPAAPPITGTVNVAATAPTPSTGL